MTESLAARDAVLERLQMTANAKADLIEMFKDPLEQQRALFERTKTSPERQLAEPKEQPDSALTEMTIQRDRLGNEVDQLSSDLSVVSVQQKTTRPQLGAAISHAETISGQ